MSKNYYAEINLHVTWHTKSSLPLLVPKIDAIAHHNLRGRCIDAAGVYIHEIGGTETHVHLAISVAPTVVISEFIGQLKGASSALAIWPGLLNTYAIRRSGTPRGRLSNLWNVSRTSRRPSREPGLKPGREKPHEWGWGELSRILPTRPEGRAYTAAREAP